MSFFLINLEKKFSFKYNYNLEASKKFIWTTGTGSEYWWQVKGCCKNIYDNENGDACPPIKISQECEGKSQYIQTLLSPNIQSLCEELKNNNWEWRICSIEKWSRPAENEFVTSQDECNILQSIEYKNIPSCLDLSRDHDILEKIKFQERIFYSKCSNLNCFGDILFYPAEGAIELSGEAEYPGRTLTQSTINKQSITENIEEKIEFKIEAIIKELVFSDKFTEQYIPQLNLVQVSCEGCSDLPNILYVDNNFINLNTLSSFLFKNDYEISDEIPINFNKTTNTWSSVMHFPSKFDEEKWKLIIDFGCSNEIDSEFYYWKLSLLFSNEKNKIKKETRLNLNVPSKFICSYSRDYMINFKYNTQNKYTFINYAAYYDNFYFSDGIGLFKSNYWTSNPDLNIKITKDKIKSRTSKKTINI